jgi:phenylacetate-coenzyme A ligase PaaK-like adenylate-forming protein
VDVEKGVFQRDNMEYLTGEYEAFLYGETGNTALRVSLECEEPEKCDRETVQENFLKSFLQYKPGLQDAYNENAFEILFNFLPEGEMEFYKAKGRPKRVVDRR